MRDKPLRMGSVEKLRVNGLQWKSTREGGLALTPSLHGV